MGGTQPQDHVVAGRDVGDAVCGHEVDDDVGVEDRHEQAHPTCGQCRGGGVEAVDARQRQRAEHDVGVAQPDRGGVGGRVVEHGAAAVGGELGHAGRAGGREGDGERPRVRGRRVGGGAVGRRGPGAGADVGGTGVGRLLARPGDERDHRRRDVGGGRVREGGAQPAEQVQAVEVVGDDHECGPRAFQHVGDLVDVVAGVDPDDVRPPRGDRELPGQDVGPGGQPDRDAVPRADAVGGQLGGEPAGPRPQLPAGDDDGPTGLRVVERDRHGGVAAGEVAEQRRQVREWRTARGTVRRNGMWDHGSRVVAGIFGHVPGRYRRTRVRGRAQDRQAPRA